MWRWRITDPKGNNIEIAAKTASEARNTYLRMFGRATDIKVKDIQVEKVGEAHVPTMFKPDLEGTDEVGFQPVAPVVNETERTRRNASCPCGSGKKFKKCCMKGAAGAGKGRKP